MSLEAIFHVNHDPSLFHMNENLSPAPLPSIPIDYETQRLRVLHSYNILDTPVEQEFDDIASLATQICGTPIALISLVDEFKQWFKARLGMNAVETPRELSFCAHALRQTVPLVVQDATRDPRFAGNLLVTEEPFIRFYAGAPLVAPSGEVLGTLCVIDHTERTLTPEQLRALTLLAREVMTHLELRRSLDILQSSEARYRQLFERHPHPMWVNDRETRCFLAVNDAAVAHYGYSREEFLAMTSDEINHDDGSGRVQHRAKDGSVLAVEITSNPMDFDGSKAAVVLAMDVTSRLAAETVLRNSETLQREAAESQAAILNALPADIALLDAHGFILAVNDSWQQLTSATAAHGRDDFVGQNYLEVCAAASVDGSPEAAQITCGLRAVLAGRR